LATVEEAGDRIIEAVAALPQEIVGGEALEGCRVLGSPRGVRLAGAGTWPKLDSFASMPWTASGAMCFDFTWLVFSFTAA
jgi:hypothetical protein